MKYFKVSNTWYHCDNIFNWKAVDADGSLYLFQNEPFPRKNTDYWTSGHTDSRDYRVYLVEGDGVHNVLVPYKPLTLDWLDSLEELK